VAQTPCPVLCPVVCLLLLLCLLFATSFSQRLNKQMGFTAIEYGVGSGLYFLGYGLFILPSTFITIKYGARRWMGCTTFVCGLLGMMHALISNRQGFFVLRCLIGLAEAGGGSSAGHLLAQFYPKSRFVEDSGTSTSQPTVSSGSTVVQPMSLRAVGPSWHVAQPICRLFSS